jgi:UDP-N-acetylmuramoyl-tripeptide--D-alanyl-D-alanine ligase
MGSTPQQIVAGLKAFTPYYMRFIVIPLKNDINLIDDTYNANPVSTSAALETFSHLASGRTVAVLGDMLELGDYASEAHLEVGKRAADLGVQVLVAVGDMAETLTRAARESATPPEEVHALRSSEEAGRVVLERCRPGDWILVKGSRGVEMELVVNAILASFPPKSTDAGESHAAPSKNGVTGSVAAVHASSGPRTR